MSLSRRKFLLSAGAFSLAAVVPLAACSRDGSGRAQDATSGDSQATAEDGVGVAVVPDDPSGVATSAALFASASTAVLVASDPTPEQVGTACTLARDNGVPVLLDGAGGDSGPVIQELSRLGATDVVLVGGSADDVDGLGDLNDITVHTVDTGDADNWPEDLDPGVAGEDLESAGVALAASTSSPVSVATTVAAGYSLTRVIAPDPRSTDESVAASVEAITGDGNLIALGDHFGTADDLRRRAELAATVEGNLPGGGQVMFPGRKIIALYGHAAEPLLGVMGEQPPKDAVERARHLAAEYDATSDVPVIPSFEIIVTVAAAEPGPSGNFSNYSDPAEVVPWIDAIVDAGGYAIIDIQPGRETLLQQAQHYADLLKNPSVGLALDPEWRLGPDDQPMVEVGHVDASEINEVADWLEGLVVAEKLPQKLLMIHQFQLQMIRNRENMTTGTDNVSVAVHCDGHGPQGVKMETWNVVRQDLDPAIALGWKNFIDEDEPMLDPAQTAAISPTPDIVSYQ
ncbi:hypothetical protein [Corynebacterium sp. AOP12-C2-36]|uniref:hypothetical protein n=1 Tax=Corynebacterium sp. AOP12-C2-36 TaxID=3457723 RepID=UPI0040335984